MVLLKMQGFHTKLTCEKLMIKQTEWGVEKLTFQIEWSITTNFFIVFENLISLYESPINS